RRGHLLDPDHEHEPRYIGLDRPDRLVDRGRAGRARVLDARCALEPQVGGRLEHERRGEVLGRETRIEMPEYDLVDVFRLYAGIGERLPGDANDQTLDGFAFELAEWRMGPSDDAGSNGGLLGFAE